MYSEWRWVSGPRVARLSSESLCLEGRAERSLSFRHQSKDATSFFVQAPGTRLRPRERAPANETKRRLTIHGRARRTAECDRRRSFASAGHGQAHMLLARVLPNVAPRTQAAAGPRTRT